MAINIIDGFYLGSSTPIDSRIVANDITQRNSILFKYDGLKVFQIDTRENWTWNASTLGWDSDGSVGGLGVVNYITKWISPTTIGTSSIFASASNIGINSSNPLSNVQINGTNQPFSINNGNYGVIGYNWYYSGVDQVFNSSVGSSQIIMDDSGSIKFKTRNPSLSFVSSLELNSNGYNYIGNPVIGNYISGSVSFGISNIPYISPQLVYINGSFRSNSSQYNKTSTITLSTNGNQILKQSGFSVTSSNPSVTNISGSVYNIDLDDDNLIVYNQSTSSLKIKLPSLGNNCFQSGRNIFINYSTGTSTTFIDVIGGTLLYALDGSIITSVTLNSGETVKLVSSYNSSNVQIWKVVQFNNSILSGNPDDFIWYDQSINKFTNTNFTNKAFDRIRNYGHNFIQSITFSSSLYSKSKSIFGSSSLMGSSKLTIYDNDLVGGLFITTPTGSSIINNAPAGGAFIEGATIIGDYTFGSKSISFGNFKLAVSNGFGGTYSKSGIMSFNTIGIYDTNVYSNYFSSESGTSSYILGVNYKDNSSLDSDWKFLRTLKNSSEMFYTDARGRTKSESIIVKKYHNIDSQNQLYYYRNNKSNLIVQLDSNFEIISSGYYQISGNNNYPTNTSDNFGYYLPSSEYGSLLTSFSINSQDFDTAHVYWTRIGQIVNCSFRIINHRGRLFSSASGLYSIKLPLPVMTSYAFNNVVVNSQGSGTWYDSNSLLTAEVSCPSGTDSKRMFYISKNQNYGRDVRGSFSYQLG